ncbi:MAG: hypothetical protein GXP55_16905 [Deltaproteobacteria bacterium]|nr:hypothetical protein [Deltaproteobacteria bacterium]
MSEEVDVFDALRAPALLVEGGVIRACNPACRSLLGAGVGPGSLEGTPIAAILRHDPVRQPTEAVRCCLGLDGRRVLMASPCGGAPFPVDVEATEAGDGLVLLVFEDARPAERLGGLVSQLGAVYLRDGGRAMVDLSALLEAMAEVFAPLGWYTVVWETRGDHVWLRQVMTPGPVEGELATFVRQMLHRRLDADDAPHLAMLAAQGSAGMLEDVPWRMANVARRRGGEQQAKQVAAQIRAAGLKRSVWASVKVSEGRRFFVIASSPIIAERDLAVVQLFAAQVGATVQHGEVSAINAREQRLAALGQMSALLAHEVRNPLAVMFHAYAQIRRRVGALAPIADLMQMVEEEARRLDKLVNDLVGFAGPTRPRLEDLTLLPLLESSIASLEESVDAVRVELCELPELPPLRADPLLFRQAMTHLLSNAADRAGQHGHVRISAEHVVGKGVRVRVANDGEGLSEDVAARVFEPFFTTKATGSGLGLAVVRRLIEDQGGRVKLDRDEPGVSFSIWLKAVE